MIYRDEAYVQLCEFDDQGEIRFTQEALRLANDFPGLRRFVSQLISHWGPEYITMLDYFGPDDSEKDTYTGIDGDPMDVREDITDVWDYKDLTAVGMDAEWYRDMMRAKLVSIKVPERLIKAYIKAANKVFT